MCFDGWEDEHGRETSRTRCWRVTSSGGWGSDGGKDEGWEWTGQPRILNRAGLMAGSARGFLILQRLEAGYRREGAGWGWGFIHFEWAFCSNSLSALAPGGAWPFPQALARRLPSTPPAWLGAYCRHLSPPTRSESSTLICLKHRALKCAFQGGLPAPIQRRRRVLGRGEGLGLGVLRAPCCFPSVG